MATTINLIPEDDITPEDLIPPFKPSMLWAPGKALCFQNVPASVKTFAREAMADGWKIYPVSQSRGRCYFRSKTITIPRFAIERGELDIGYKVWYISHELSHAFAGYQAKHGPEFMDMLKQICPREDIHHEIEYKPRNAIAAGITRPFTIDLF